MADPTPQQSNETPAMGEKRARWGYGYQDKVATARILDILRSELRLGTQDLEGVRLADVQAGRVDDFVLVHKTQIQGNSIKWAGDAAPMNWGDLVGANGLLKELSEGFSRLSQTWPNKTISVALQSNRPGSTEKHHAQLITAFSVAEFLSSYWAHGPGGRGGTDIDNAWLTIRQHTGLQEGEFARFIATCKIILGVPEPPPPGPDTDDRRHYLKQFDGLHKAIATWITNNPTTEFIPRQFLLEAIGFQAYRSALIQSFPVPRIPYERNVTAAEKLKRLISETRGGYLAVTGPAGVGKSTLVQDVVSEYPFFIPYYAYLPDGQGNPRDRGAALTFFQDVILRLDKFLANRLSLGISDVAQGRSALRQHMARAHELLISDERKTILLIDGLDHVSREVGIDTPLLFELPRPEEVPDGFLIILSSQPQALIPGVIEQHVAQEVALGSPRRLNVDGLTRDDVYAIVARSNKPTDSEERETLFTACQGNPLILTYLLNAFEADSQTTVAETVATVGNYTGDIDKYYRDALSVSLTNATNKAVLALISRAAPIIPTTWLQQWPEHAQIEELYYRLLAPFLREEAGQLYFIHNSLIAFLKDQTRSLLPGADLEHDERRYHSILADRCGNPPCTDPLGRAKVLHLFRAKRDRELLDLLSSKWLREAITGFLPYSEVGYLIRLGFDTAWRLQEYGHVIRLVLLNYELAERTNRLEAGDLADAFLELDDPEMAVRRIRFAGRILVDDKVALRFASDLWNYGRSRNRPNLQDTARTIYLQAKPLNLIYQGEPIDTSRHHDFADTLHSWAAAAPLFEPAPKVIEQINRVQFKDPQDRRDVDRAAIRAGLLFEAFFTVLGWNGADAYRPFLDELRQTNQPHLLFEALLMRHREAPSDALLQELETLHAALLPDEDFDLVFATVLYENGHSDKARTIAARLNYHRFDGSENRHALGLSDVSYAVMLSYMQGLLGLDPPPPATVNNEEDEASARIEVAARRLGIIRAQVRTNKPVQDFAEVCRATLLFHNRPIAFVENGDWRHNYLLGFAKKDIYEQLIELAQIIGDSGMRVLSAEFLHSIEGPAGSQFAVSHRRLFLEAFFASGTFSAQDASALGLSSLSDTEDDDPVQRQRACLDVALFLYGLNKADPTVREWIGKAAELSAGAGNHKDYHIALLSEWLIHSIGTDLNDANRRLLSDFCRAIEVSGGAGGSRAATAILRWLPTVDPTCATSLATEFIDRDVLNVSETLEALTIGCARAGTSPQLVAAVYCELLSLIHPRNTSDVAVTVLKSFPLNERVSIAEQLINSVRTNSVPSHRVEIARAVQDALREDGLGEFTFTQGLKPGYDDSAWKRALYTLATGDVLTTDQVAQRLGRFDQPQDWNPNPTANTEFDWWDAMQKTQIANTNHLNALLAAFPPPNYRAAEVLAWKSKEFLRMGDRATAKQMAEEAFEQSQTGSWFTWLDGAKLRIAYGALKPFDTGTLPRAREQFGKDLAEGKLHTTYLLDDIIDIFNFLEITWPSASSLDVIKDYLIDVLAANRAAPEYSAFTNQAKSTTTTSEALCRFVFQLLAFPVIDVGVAARRSLARYAVTDGTALITLFRALCLEHSIQLETLLSCVHVGLHAGSPNLFVLQDDVRNLNKHASIAVRNIARRICDDQNWGWQQIRDQQRGPTIIIAAAPAASDRETAMLLGDDSRAQAHHYRNLFRLLADAGNDPAELESEFNRYFRDVASKYAWSDRQRFQRWKKLVLAEFWLNESVLVGREAVMRLIGQYSLSGRAPTWLEEQYDFLYPVYDPALELLSPIERPKEMVALNWETSGDGKKNWLEGKGTENWTDYPTSIDGFQIIGERTLFIRPEWEWPREERHRGLLIPDKQNNVNRKSLGSKHELTYRTYLEGIGQEEHQLIIWNREELLLGPSYRWMGINSKVAEQLGWTPSDTDPFHWLDREGTLMVKSVFWRDGWIDIVPPRFESLGEGWLVLATPAALDVIRRTHGDAQYHLWVERESHGRQPYSGSWHLVSPIGRP